MSDTVYRFLPWARRGLAAALPPSNDADAVPAHPRVDIRVVVGGGVGPVQNETTLHGPGDVIGLDPTVIVRTLPRPHATNVEPNYLAAVDFDQPELPWTFTPTGVPASGHLRPWLVLVVVRDRPGVSVTLPAGARLPQLIIDSGASEELPDLADSWAWAHVQLLDEDAGATPSTVGQALSRHPARNVSRLVCPRRLEPDARWIACLVPAFDAGVVRGLGGTPTQTELGPAWQDPSRITLPVYFHWNFQTGPQGDFESLARRLKPIEASADIGRVPMYVKHEPFVGKDLVGDQRFLQMDGALRAPTIARERAGVPDPSLEDVPDSVEAELVDVIRVLADAADGVLDGQASGDDAALGPPVYAGRHARRSTVTDSDATWLRELNTDPRCRVAAGLGTEVMRRFQEDVMEACWQQVGDVLAVEAALSRARLSLELGRRFQTRHLARLPDVRLLLLAAPLLDRVRLDSGTVPTEISHTSFPDRGTDAAMRRYTSVRGRVLAGVIRRALTRQRESVMTAGVRLLATLATGRADVDATRFPTIALDGPTSPLPNAEDGSVSLERFGVAVVLDQTSARALGRASRELAEAPRVPADQRLRVRDDLLSTGMITSAHIAAAREFSGAQVHGLLTAPQADRRIPTRALASTAMSAVIDLVLAGGTGPPGEAGFLLETGPRMKVRRLAVRSGGRLVAVTEGGVPDVTIARLDRRLGGSAREIGDLVARLPRGTFDPRREIQLRPGATEREVVVRPHSGRVVEEPLDAARPGRTTVTMPPLLKDVEVIRRYESAITHLDRVTVIGTDPVEPRLVPFGLAAAAAAVRERSDPDRVHPARLDTMLSVAGHRLSAVLADPTIAPAWRVPARFDRVMAFPRLALPAYHYLATYDRTRLCPGIDTVPPESITLLTTNPRFIAAFMAGLNHETNRELLWRAYPTDGRGTPWQRFWQRADGGLDILEVHTWGARGGRDDLPVQTSDPDGNLVLLLRGDLLRRYPNAMAVAVKAVRVGHVQRPSDQPADLVVPVFAGQFDPDVSFFGFPLVDADLTTGEGWYFGLLEPVTEPRFGFDETAEDTAPSGWDEVAWTHLDVPAGGQLRVSQLAELRHLPSVGQADGVAAALFQRPFKLLVHARHLVEGI